MLTVVVWKYYYRWHKYFIFKIRKHLYLAYKIIRQTSSESILFYLNQTYICVPYFDYLIIHSLPLTTMSAWPLTSHHDISFGYSEIRYFLYRWRHSKTKNDVRVEIYHAMTPHKILHSAFLIAIEGYQNQESVVNL